MSKVVCGNCGECPAVMHLVSSIEHYDAAADALVERVMDPEIETKISRTMQEFSKDGKKVVVLGPKGEVLESPEEVGKSMRMQGGDHLEYLDKERAEAVAEINELTANCPSPLKMRATKAGQQVTATVCMSPAVPTGTVNCEQSHVVRRPLEQN